MPQVTFMCDRYEYAFEELCRFSIRCKVRVIIRGYCEINNGVARYFQ